MLPVSTRSELATKHGLAPFVRRLLQKGVPAVVVEPAAVGVPLNGTPEILASVDPKVTAFIGPATPPAEHPEAHLAVFSAPARAAAVQALAETQTWLAATHCRRLALPIGAAGFAEEKEVRTKLAAAAADRGAIVRDFRAVTTSQRQSHAEFVCRSLFELRGRLAGVKLLLLPTEDPLSFLDPETLEWILGEVKGPGLALDTGAVWAAHFHGGPPLSDWLGRSASSLGLILLADHDGRGDGALLPGAGRAEIARLRDVIGPGLPHAVRCDSRASLDDVLASSEETRRRLGVIGDPSEW